RTEPVRCKSWTRLRLLRGSFIGRGCCRKWIQRCRWNRGNEMDFQRAPDEVNQRDQKMAGDGQEKSNEVGGSKGIEHQGGNQRQCAGKKGRCRQTPCAAEGQLAVGEVRVKT